VVPGDRSDLESTIISLVEFSSAGQICPEAWVQFKAGFEKTEAGAALALFPLHYARYFVHITYHTSFRIKLRYLLIVSIFYTNS